MSKPVLYVYRGDSSWMVLSQGKEMPTPFPRTVDVDVVIKQTRTLYPGYEVRVWNWHAPKRDWAD